MEAHTWLRVLTEARRPRARMAKGTLAETTVVPVVIAVSVGSCLVVDGRTANQTNVHSGQPTYLSAWESSHLNSKLLTMIVFGKGLSG